MASYGSNASTWLRTSGSASAVAGVDVHLPAAGLLLREHDLVPEPLEQLYGGLADVGKSASARQVTKRAMRMMR